MNLNLKARLVAAIAQFKASTDIRYYLNGVYVEPHPEGGVILVATNGHSLGIWHDASGEVGRPIIINVTKPLLAACAGGKEIDNRRLVDKNGRLTVVDKTNAEIYIQGEHGKKFGAEQYEIEGNFPDWRKVVPAIEPGRTQLFNVFQPQYLRQASEAVRTACGHDNWGAALTLRQPAPDKGIIVQSSNPEATGFIAVIMPMRDERELSVPAWAAAKLPETPPQAMPSDAAPVYDAVADGVAVKFEPGVDPLYADAVAIVREKDTASISLVQRRLSIGYNHAARLIDEMEKAGVVTRMDVNGHRVVLPAMATDQTEGGAV